MTTYVIQRLGHLGDGIADGPIFAPLTLPGEMVSGQIEKDHLRDVKIVEPSSDRVAAPCRHFRTCGGCQLQHASLPFLANWKTEVVASALEAHDLTAQFLPMAVSPPKSRRRATFSARRTKKGAMAGFHAKASDVLVEIPDCQLLSPGLMAALPAAEALAIAGASRKRGMKVAATLSAAGLDVSVLAEKPLDGPFRIELAALAEAHDLARLTWGGETVVERRSLKQAFDGLAVAPPPNAFLQATEMGEAALRDDVVRIVAGARRVVDLFAGCGTFSLPLARCAEIHAVEGDKDMLAALDAGWRRAGGLKKVSIETRDLFRRPLMPDELRGFEAAVIDPPRGGAEAQITTLCDSGIPAIAYVSCNPVTFARDARALVDAGYDLKALRVVDQFLWSAHVELVAEFQLKTA